MDENNNGNFLPPHQRPSIQLDPDTFLQLFFVLMLFYVNRHNVVLPFRYMEFHFLRLITFRNFPRNRPDIRDFAETGFYYSGRMDYVICYSCGLHRGNWEANDNPVDDHRRRSPQCFVFRANFQGHLPNVNFPERFSTVRPEHIHHGPNLYINEYGVGEDFIRRYLQAPNEVNEHIVISGILPMANLPTSPEQRFIDFALGPSIHSSELELYSAAQEVALTELGIQMRQNGSSASTYLSSVSEIPNNVATHSHEHSVSEYLYHRNAFSLVRSSYVVQENHAEFLHDVDRIQVPLVLQEIGEETRIDANQVDETEKKTDCLPESYFLRRNRYEAANGHNTPCNPATSPTIIQSIPLYVEEARKDKALCADHSSQERIMCETYPNGAVGWNESSLRVESLKDYHNFSFLAENGRSENVEDIDMPLRNTQMDFNGYEDMTVATGGETCPTEHEEDIFAYRDTENENPYQHQTWQNEDNTYKTYIQNDNSNWSESERKYQENNTSYTDNDSQDIYNTSTLDEAFPDKRTRSDDEERCKSEDILVLPELEEEILTERNNGNKQPYTLQSEQKDKRCMIYSPDDNSEYHGSNNNTLEEYTSARSVDILETSKKDIPEENILEKRTRNDTDEGVISEVIIHEKVEEVSSPSISYNGPEIRPIAEEKGPKLYNEIVSNGHDEQFETKAVTKTEDPPQVENSLQSLVECYEETKTEDKRQGRHNDKYSQDVVEKEVDSEDVQVPRSESLKDEFKKSKDVMTEKENGNKHTEENDKRCRIYTPNDNSEYHGSNIYTLEEYTSARSIDILETRKKDLLGENIPEKRSRNDTDEGVISEVIIHEKIEEESFPSISYNGPENRPKAEEKDPKFYKETVSNCHDEHFETKAVTNKKDPPKVENCLQSLVECYEETKSEEQGRHNDNYVQEVVEKEVDPEDVQEQGKQENKDNGDVNELASIKEENQENGASGLSLSLPSIMEDYFDATQSQIEEPGLSQSLPSVIEDSFCETNPHEEFRENAEPGLSHQLTSVIEDPTCELQPHEQSRGQEKQEGKYNDGANEVEILKEENQEIEEPDLSQSLPSVIEDSFCETNPHEEFRENGEPGLSHQLPSVIEDPICEIQPHEQSREIEEPELHLSLSSLNEGSETELQEKPTDKEEDTLTYIEPEKVKADLHQTEADQDKAYKTGQGMQDGNNIDAVNELEILQEEITEIGEHGLRVSLRSSRDDSISVTQSQEKSTDKRQSTSSGNLFESSSSILTVRRDTGDKHPPGYAVQDFNDEGSNSPLNSRIVSPRDIVSRTRHPSQSSEKEELAVSCHSNRDTDYNSGSIGRSVDGMEDSVNKNLGENVSIANGRLKTEGHIENAHHNHDKEIIYQCKLCYLFNTDKASLIQHLNKVHNGFCYICEGCEREFGRRNAPHVCKKGVHFVAFNRKSKLRGKQAEQEAYEYENEQAQNYIIVKCIAIKRNNNKKNNKLESMTSTFMSDHSQIQKKGAFQHSKTKLTAENLLKSKLESELEERMKKLSKPENKFSAVSKGRVTQAVGDMEKSLNHTAILHAIGAKSKQQHSKHKSSTEKIGLIREHQEGCIQLNIGGTIFHTSKVTLSNSRCSVFPQLLQDAQRNPIFIDRDPCHFSFILNFLRNKCKLPHILFPTENISLTELLLEAQFYEIKELIEELHTFFKR